MSSTMTYGFDLVRVLGLRVGTGVSILLLSSSPLRSSVFRPSFQCIVSIVLAWRVSFGLRIPKVLRHGSTQFIKSSRDTTTSSFLFHMTWGLLIQIFPWSLPSLGLGSCCVGLCGDGCLWHKSRLMASNYVRWELVIGRDFIPLETSHSSLTVVCFVQRSLSFTPHEFISLQPFFNMFDDYELPWDILRYFERPSELLLLKT